MTEAKKNFLFIISLIFAIWFTLAGMVWVYFLPIITAYPFGITSYFIWKKLYKIELERKRNKILISILIIGLMLSIIVLIVGLIQELFWELF